jgi:uncharacterized protein involved in exopolysaccharide biosynthesis/Mrp family chromosome partitioning ATPase
VNAFAIRIRTALSTFSDPRFSLVGATGQGASADAFSGRNPWREAAALLARQVRRHAGAILLAALVGAALAGLAKSVLPTTYKSTAEILINPQQREASGENAPDSTLDANAAINYVESQMGVIGSERVLLRVIREQGLAGEPAVAPGESKEAPESAQGSRAADLAESRALVVLRNTVTITRAERSFLVGLTVAADDPQKAARLANALVEAYGEVTRIDRNAAASDRAAELDKRIEDVRRQLGAGEAQLQDFKSARNLGGLNDKSVEERMTSDAADALSAAENREALARSRLKQLDAGLADVASVAAFGQDPESRQLQVLIEERAAAAAELERLESTLGARHPALEAARLQMNGFDQRIALSVQGLRRAARAQLAEAQGQTAALKQKLTEVAAGMSKTHEYDAPLKEIEDTLASKLKALIELETRRREASDLSQAKDVNFRIVSPARAPIDKNPAATLVLWSVSGALAGAALALAALALTVLFEESDETIRAAASSLSSNTAAAPPPTENAETRLRKSGDGGAGDGEADRKSTQIVSDLSFVQLPVIAPPAGRRELSIIDAMSEATRHPDSPYSRAVAALLPRLKPPPGSGLVVVLVTAAAPRLGASTLAVNLARLAAARGLRALLIDAHQAHPSLDLAIPRDAPKTQIELAGQRRQLYRLPPFRKSLSVIPAPAPEDRLFRFPADNSAKKGIDGIAGKFDFVIFDGPPAGDVVALRALVPAVGGLLLLHDDECGPADRSRILRRLGLVDDQFALFVRAAPRETDEEAGPSFALRRA